MRTYCPLSCNLCTRGCDHESLTSLCTFPDDYLLTPCYEYRVFDSCALQHGCGQSEMAVQNRANALRNGCVAASTGPTITSVDRSIVISVPQEGKDIVFDFGGSQRVSQADLYRRLAVAEMGISTNADAIAANGEAIDEAGQNLNSLRSDFDTDVAALQADVLSVRGDVSGVAGDLERFETAMRSDLQAAAEARADLLQAIGNVREQVEADVSAQLELLREEVDGLNEFVSDLDSTDYDHCFNEAGMFLEESDSPRCKILQASFVPLPPIVIHHNRESEGHCRGCESAMCCRSPMIQYDIDPTPLLESSKYSCVQTIEYRCYGSGIWSCDSTCYGGYSKQSDGQMRCFCNDGNIEDDSRNTCDHNDNTWRKATIVLRGDALPVTRVGWGDTGDSGEQGFWKVSPITCTRS